MRINHLFAIALSALAALSASAADHDVKVIAHRGYWTAPGSAQNSIDALAQAAKA